MTRNYPEDVSRILSQAQAERMVATAMRAVRGGGTTEVRIGSIWQQTIGWANNTNIIASDRQKQMLYIERGLQNFGRATAISNQYDDQSILNTVGAAEQRSLNNRTHVNMRTEPYRLDPPPLAIPQIPLWSDHTAANSALGRSRLGALLSRRAEQEGLTSAGTVNIRMASYAYSDSVYGTFYTRYTNVECSVTVRHPKGKGSGWAGLSSVDWNTIDIDEIANRALTKCIESFDAVRIEPGRYTVILEPQATADLVQQMILAFNREGAENEHYPHPFKVGYDKKVNKVISKLGTRILDDRITISQNPKMQATAEYPYPGMRSITWVEKGVLISMHNNLGMYSRARYALPELNTNIHEYFRRSFHMSGGDTSIPEMIATTKRGVLVTHLSDLVQLDRMSLLYTGVTRDGLWLIENGKITKPAKNLRFVESPLFVLNQIEQLGPPTSVFCRTDGTDLFGRLAETSMGRETLRWFEYLLGPRGVVVPPIKARDFNFVALVDAV